MVNTDTPFFSKQLEGPLSMFTQEQWTQMRSATLPLHQLLIDNKSDEEIVSAINCYTGKKVDQLTAADPKGYRLTPLHVAVMRGREIIVIALLQKKVPIEAKDEFEWTPLHHAALCSEKIYQLLLKQGANLQAKTITWAGVEELKILIGRTPCRLSMQKITWISPQPSVKKLFAMSGEELASATGLRYYTDTPIFLPNLWERLWKLQPPSPEEFTRIPLQYYYEKYEEWVKNPPSLILTTCPQLKGKTPLPLEIRSGQDLPIGTVISEYSGLATPILPPLINFPAYFTTDIDGSFHLDDYDAKEAGNAARWANSGFPNCALVDIGNYAGAHRYLLLLMESVPKNTPLIWDYGVKQAALTFGSQVLLEREAARTFFKQGLKALCTKANLLKTQMIRPKAGRMPEVKSEDFLCLQLMVNRMHHPLNCPGTLLDLHFSHIIRAEEWLPNLSNPTDEVYSIWGKNNLFFGPIIRSVVLRILELEKVLETNPKIKEQVNQWVLASIGNLSIMQILQGFEEIKKDGSRIEKESEYFLQLTLKLKNYDWLKEENAPLSLARRKVDKLNALRSIMSDEQILFWAATAMNEMQLNPQSDNFQILLWVVEQIKGNNFSKGNKNDS